jgi:hypothetical protein
VNAPLWAIELAEVFWADARDNGPWPRDLRTAATNALPLSIVTLQALGVQGVADWLREIGLALPVDGPDRRLRGFLVAYEGQGVVFLDADDPEDEQRFTLAHEIAHFLRDYRRPRQRAVDLLGPDVLDVLDGRRPARVEERLHGVLRGVLIGVHQHLLARAERGPLSSNVAAAERDADRLAFELLAPAAQLRGLTDAAVLRRRLVAEYGLPAEAAGRYAALLAPTVRRCPLLERLRSRAGSVSDGAVIDRR